MKNTTTTNKLLTKACLLALVLPAASHAQTHYDWTISDDEAHWGPNPNYHSGGSYTRDYVKWTGSGMGRSGIPGWGHNHGPYDGMSGAIYGYVSTGIMTRTDDSAVFDLSSTGSSGTIRMAYHFSNKTGDTGGHAHMYQFGLTNNDSYFGKAGDESLFVAADFQNYSSAQGMLVDLDLLDHTGADTTGDGNWTPTPIATVAEDLVLKSWEKSHAIELTYTNVGNGQLKLDVGVMDLNITGKKASDTVASTNQVVQESYLIDHNFSDLSALRPGFGMTISDSLIPTSGGNFDWEEAYPTGFAPVPEPSSASLLGLGIAGFLLRRKR